MIKKYTFKKMPTLHLEVENPFHLVSCKSLDLDEIVFTKF